MGAWWTAMPRQRGRDGAMVDLRVQRCGGGSRRRWLRVRSPAFHRGATSRHWQSLCLGVTTVFLSVHSPEEEMCDDSNGLSYGHHGPQAGDTTVLCSAA